MKKTALILFCAGFLFFGLATKTAEAQAQWSIGYYVPAGTAFGPPFAVSSIQWAGLTHVTESAAYVNADGTLDLTTAQISSTAAALVSAAHAHNVKALLSIGQSTHPNLPDAIANHLSALVTNVMAAVNTYGFDGVDIDWEPFYVDTESTAMTALSAALRSALGSKLLTVAVENLSTYWGKNPYFDRFNVMTYSGTGTWYGTGLWFTDALYATGADSSYIYGMSWYSAAYQSAGVPASKLGLGIAFFGNRWTGGTLASDPTQGISGPRQAWQTGVAPSGPTAITYAAILPLITKQNYYWDAAAVVPYLGVPGTPSTSWYLTYDNPQSVAAKVQYAIAQGLGGWIIWALDEDYVPGNSHPHPLLDAVAQAMDTTHPTPGSSGTITTASVTSNSLTLNWIKGADDTSAKGTLKYRVYQSSSNNITTVANMYANGTPLNAASTTDIATLPVTGLSPATTYYFNVIVQDEAGNTAAYTTKPQATLPSDLTPPTVDTYSPANNATGVATSSNLILTFNKNVVKGTGNILIKNSVSDATVQTIDVNSADVSISNATVTINPADLSYNTGYYVTMASGVLIDTASPTPNAYAGILGGTTWNFTTVASPAKAITAFTIPSQVGLTTINESLHTIALTMPYNT